MKILISLFILLNFNISNANSELKIMSFNTMCDICKGSDYFSYSERLKTIQKIIKKYKPDLIALQEIRSSSHILELLSTLPEYDYFTNESFFFSYADPTLIYLKNKFKKKTSGTFWLGPEEGKFSFGWKLALPRQAIWIELEHQQKNFIFLSTHFDNRIENLNSSAKMIGKKLKEFDKPIIFAADTNITPDMDAYQELLSDLMINVFQSANFKVSKEIPSQDLCYLRKGDKFPDCRVDHILLSKDGPWDIKEFIVDTTRSPSGKFPSDHRPIISKIQLRL